MAEAKRFMFLKIALALATKSSFFCSRQLFLEVIESSDNIDGCFSISGENMCPIMNCWHITGNTETCFGTMNPFLSF